MKKSLTTTVTTYTMATTHDFGSGYQAVGDKSKVTEELFYKSLNNEIKILTADLPDKFEETYKKAKDCLNTGKALTVNNTWFQINTKKVKSK